MNYIVRHLSALGIVGSSSPACSHVSCDLAGVYSLVCHVLSNSQRVMYILALYPFQPGRESMTSCLHTVWLASTNKSLLWWAAGTAPSFSTALVKKDAGLASLPLWTITFAAWCFGTRFSPKRLSSRIRDYRLKCVRGDRLRFEHTVCPRGVVAALV